MKGLAFLSKGIVGVLDKPVPEIRPNDALVRTTAALICSSDVHTVRGVIPIPEGRVLGHESVGVVEKVGAAVAGFKKGDRVAVNAITPCGHCDACQRGVAGQCGGMLGGYKFTGQRDGNMAELFVVNDADYNLVGIPDGLEDEKAVYACDMMSTGFAGAEGAAIPIGGSVAIFAQGPVGLCATAGARLLGAALIIAVESKPDRQELARRFGADHVVDPSQGDPVAEILALSGGAGVDSAIEALGHPATFANCIRTTRPGGTISNIGFHGEFSDMMSIPVVEFGFGMSDKTIRAILCPGGRERMGRLFRILASGRFDPTPMTTHRFPFSDVVKAFHMMETKEDGIVKPLIRFG